MYKFFIFTLLLSAVSSKHASLEGSSKDEVKEAYHKLMNIVDDVINEAQTELNEALNAIKAEATELGNKAKVELDETLEPLRKELNDAVAKAQAKGFDVTKCQNYVDDFSQTPDKMSDDLVGCFNQQIETGQKYTNDALDNARQLEQKLNTIDSDIDNCGGNFIKKAACYAEIALDIADDVVEVPKKISSDVDNTVTLIQNIGTNLENCATGQVKQAGENAAQDVANFAICAAV